MSLVKHAKKEFYLAGWCDENGVYSDDMQKMMAENLLEAIDVIAKQGHTGFSMGYFRKHLDHLLDYKILTPLTGEDDEWIEHDDGLFQNKRMTTVFKRDGKAYDHGSIYFWHWFDDEDGKPYKVTFQKGGWSHYPEITFPYMPDKPKGIFDPTDKYPNEVLDN